MIYKLIMLSEKQQIWGIWLSAENLTHSKSMGILDYIKCRYSKTAFWKNWNLACRVILSIYTFYVIFKQIWAWHRSRPSYLKEKMESYEKKVTFLYLKGHWTSITSSPNFFKKKKKKNGIFIPSEVLAWVMTACWVLHPRLTYFWRDMNISSIFYFIKVNFNKYTIQ